MKQFVAKFEKLKQKFQATFSKPLSQSTAVTIIVLLSWLVVSIVSQRNCILYQSSLACSSVVLVDY